MSKFEIVGGGFLRDDVEHRVLSGAMHYFRVMPEQWRHRLRMLRAMGLNCVETYVPWNLHEPRRGEFTAVPQLARFLACAAEEGLDAIVRPGPYICAEWDNGGLPFWLTGPVRCSHPAFLEAVDAWFDVLIPVLAAHQVTRGGNVIMVQVENEYGSYGSDREYLRHLADGLRARGIEVPLFTSDGPTDLMLTGGTLPDVLATVNFGTDPEAAFTTLRGYRPGDPLFCMEFWCGWFDHWGAEHVTRDADEAAAVLRRILETGASVNIYMAHGGTSFGTWAGANRAGPLHSGALQPDVTSYDYDAPIDERGAPTRKFWRFREVLRDYLGSEPPPVPDLPPLLEARPVELPETLGLFDVMADLPRVESPMPPSFEELGLGQGLVLYRCALPGPRTGYPLKIMVADRAHLFIEGAFVGVLDENSDDLTVSVAGERAEIALLAESMGRVNYGPLAGERKGVAGVLHGQQYVHGFTASMLCLDDISGLPWGRPRSIPDGPVFSRGWIEAGEPCDAYLAVRGGGKGYLWVNGFLLGRYWTAGPQETLYMPWPVLRPGRNEIVVLELDETSAVAVEIRTDAPGSGRGDWRLGNRAQG